MKDVNFLANLKCKKKWLKWLKFQFFFHVWKFKLYQIGVSLKQFSFHFCMIVFQTSHNYVTLFIHVAFLLDIVLTFLFQNNNSMLENELFMCMLNPYAILNFPNHIWTNAHNLGVQENHNYNLLSCSFCILIGIKLVNCYVYICIYLFMTSNLKYTSSLNVLTT